MLRNASSRRIHNKSTSTCSKCQAVFNGGRCTGQKWVLHKIQQASNIFRTIQVHLCADPTPVPSMHPSLSLPMNQSIYSSIHPFIMQPPIHSLSNHPFIHAVKQLSSQPTHTPLIQWLTLHWVDQYSLKWYSCKCLGTMARHCLCS